MGVKKKIKINTSQQTEFKKEIKKAISLFMPLLQAYLAPPRFMFENLFFISAGPILA